MTDPEIAPFPPHISRAQAKAFMSSLAKGDRGAGQVIADTASQLVSEVLPGKRGKQVCCRDFAPAVAQLDTGQAFGGAVPALKQCGATQAIKAREDRQEVFYTTAIEPQYFTDGMRLGQPIALEEGEYVQFTYQGPKAGLQNFILDIYGHCLPMMKLIRRERDDIERFRLAAGQSESADMFLCDYLIPILRESRVYSSPSRCC